MRIGASTVPLIRLLQNWTPVIDAARPRAVRISKKTFTIRHGIRCGEKKTTEMTPIVISGGSITLRIDTSWWPDIPTAPAKENPRTARAGRIAPLSPKPVLGVAGRRWVNGLSAWGTGTIASMMLPMSRESIYRV